MPASGIVVVTGASTGIGAACALRLDRAGWTVLAGVRTEEAGEQLKAQAGARLQPLILDVTDDDQVAAAVTRVHELGGRLAGLVNNAGIAVTGPLEAIDDAEWRRQFDVNFFGQVAVTKALLPALRSARGRIVFMSSVGGRMAAPYFGPYAASKFAVEGMADALRRELRSFGVRVAIVEPGSIATGIWDKGTNEAADALAAMPSDKLAVYGDGMRALARVAESTGARGIPPEEVAEAVEHALTARRPRTRYPVGRDAHVQTWAQLLLPAAVFDRVVIRHMGIG